MPYRANRRRRFRTDHLEMGTVKVHRQGDQRLGKWGKS